jgi:hypothetical protein
MSEGEEKKHCQEGNPPENQIPVCVFWTWDEKKPGFCETDTVFHDGGQSAV